MFDRIPAEVRELYRTAWELPQRALIDMAADRTPVPRPEPVAEPLHGDADHRQAQLDVRVRVEAGAEDHVLPAVAAGHPDRPRGFSGGLGTCALPAPAARRRTGDRRRRRDRLLPGKPRVLRGMPVMTTRAKNLLDPGFELTLRPMRYPDFYERYRDAIKNTWTVEEVDLHSDVADLRQALTPAEQHLIGRLVAFFATGDSIVANNLVLTLYKHINSPEARLYLSRQLFEEAVHVQFYLTLLDTYLPDPTTAPPPSPRSRTSPRSARRPSSASAGWTRSRTSTAWTTATTAAVSCST